MRLPNQTPAISRHITSACLLRRGIRPSYGKCWTGKNCTGKEQRGKTDLHNCCNKYSGKSLCENNACTNCSGSSGGAC